MDTNFTSDLPASGLVAIPVAQDALDGAGLASLDKKLGGALMRAARASEFVGKAGQDVTVAGPEGMEDAVVMLLGVGQADGFSARDAQKLGGKAAALSMARHAKLSIVLKGTPLGALREDELAAQVAFGANLRAYDFGLYRKEAEPDDKPKLRAITIVTEDAAAAEKAFADDEAVAAGVKLARDLVSEPPNILYPASFADRARELEGVGVQVEILGEAEMEKLGMGSLLGVGQGSRRESKLAIMRWKGGGDERPIALVGKGVTFDTGGISLKPGAGMEDMKMDMGGAAAVTGAMRALAGRKAKSNVVGLIGLVENMPDGNAIRPADVLTSMSGRTIEVLNTDAEGRLVLADVLTYAQERYKPAAIVDLATLTGAIIISLADQYAGLFTEDDPLAAALLAAGEASGERLWRMPLGDWHRDQIKSDIADMKNVGGKGGGSSTAAAFLSRFVEDETSWAHLDIAGMAWAKKDDELCPKGATGFGVRLLDAFVRSRTE